MPKSLWDTFFVARCNLFTIKSKTSQLNLKSMTHFISTCTGEKQLKALLKWLMFMLII